MSNIASLIAEVSSFKNITASLLPFPLTFKKPATTSRGTLYQKKGWLIRVTAPDSSVLGWGEYGPLPGLSPEWEDDPEQIANHIIGLFNNRYFKQYVVAIQKYPALLFAFETAFKGLLTKNPFLFASNAFTTNQKGIPINGLIWMDTFEVMYTALHEKIAQGFSCIKIKIGGIQFEQECALLDAIRKIGDADSLTIRLDANGSFSVKDAMEKLNILAKFNIHSIEQPIAPGNTTEMRWLCQNSPIPIALDEELIGVRTENEKEKLLESLQPAFIILKPTLIGGIAESEAWIQMAQQHNIQWWATSALESNIGLNAIAQWVSAHSLSLHQGLGTGNLYVDNIQSPLYLEQDKMYYNPTLPWQPITA